MRNIFPVPRTLQSGPSSSERTTANHWWRPFPGWTPLIGILAVQAVLSVRLVHANTAFQDEALYIWAGHLEIAHWVHGTSIPAFGAYFSGAPVIFPPLAALADSLGGLTAARILSLLFMLGATSFLWTTTSLLFNRRSAFFASTLFAILGTTIRLGAFATYDAMSLCLLALSAWCAVRAGSTERHSGWLVCAATALAFANATKYVSAIFDPVVAGVMLAMGGRTFPWRYALGRAVTMLVYAASIVLLLLAFGGSEYVQSIFNSTLSRARGSDSTVSVLQVSWRLTGLLVVLAFAGALMTWIRAASSADKLLMTILALATLIVPISQARIHTLVSLDKHVDFGAWFASIAAGVAVDWLVRLVRVPRIRMVATASCIGLMAIPLHVGLRQSSDLFHSWPNSTSLMRTLRSELAHRSGPILAEHPSLPEFYLRQGTQWYRWSSTYVVRLPNGHSISAVAGSRLAVNSFVRRINHGYFSVIVLDFGPTARMDEDLVASLKRNPNYQLVADVPYGRRGAEVWAYRTQPRVSTSALSPPSVAVPIVREVLNPVERPSRVLGPILLATEITGAIALILMLLIRYGWRRGKASQEL